MSLFRRASSLSQREYEQKIARGLARAREAAAVEERQLAELRAVVFSDLHRGARDGADDFERCEPAYSAALGWYLERGYELHLLGDVDELWENDIGEVLPRYQAAAALERAFLEGPGLRRFFGNHDLDWRDEKLVRRHLDPLLPGIRVHEALRLRVLDGDVALGELFLVHGHQGTDLSERSAWLSRLALRQIWRKIQNSQGWLSTTPAESHDLRHKHDLAMFRWACGRAREEPRDQRPVLIAGHTHHPVFPDSGPPLPEPAAEIERIAAELAAARGRGAREDELAPLRAELERLRALTRRAPYRPPAVDPPCYFNTGCCCFPDRDVTCLELSDGRVRLTRWLDDDGTARPAALAEMPLREVFRRMAAA
jgi:UDP-2,3-diacylglucosamine pyrophosphatase LpxH